MRHTKCVLTLSYSKENSKLQPRSLVISRNSVCQNKSTIVSDLELRGLEHLYLLVGRASEKIKNLVGCRLNQLSKYVKQKLKIETLIERLHLVIPYFEDSPQQNGRSRVVVFNIGLLKEKVKEKYSTTLKSRVIQLCSHLKSILNDDLDHQSCLNQQSFVLQFCSILAQDVLISIRLFRDLPFSIKNESNTTIQNLEKGYLRKIKEIMKRKSF